MCKELKRLAHHYNNKLKTEKTKKSTIFLGSIREKGTQGEVPPPTLEKETGKCGESWRTWAEIQKQKLAQKPTQGR